MAMNVFRSEVDCQTFQVVEKIERAEAQQRLRELPPHHHDIIPLQNILKHSRDGRLKVTYSRSSKCKTGRFYADHGAQRLTRRTRDLVVAASFIDLDIANCHPVICAWIMRRNNISCPMLEAYVNNRQEIISHIIERSKGALSRECVKQAFLTELYFGSYRQATGDRKVRELDVFHHEIRRGASLLLSLPVYAGFLFAAREQKRPNPTGSALSHVLQKAETEAMCLTLQYLQEHKLGTPNGWIYDGFYCSPLSPSQIQALEDHVETRMGLPLRLVAKPRHQDAKQIRPILRAGEKIVLFGRQQLIDDNHELVEKLASHGYSIGLYTFEELMGKSPLRVALGRDYTYRPDKQYQTEFGVKRIKSLREYFALEQVLLVDDPQNVCRRDRHRCVSPSNLVAIVDGIICRGLFAQPSPRYFAPLQEGPLATWKPAVLVEAFDEAFVRQITVKPSTRVLCIKGAMGCGKTSRLSERFAALMHRAESERAPPPRILIVTPRVSLTQSLRARFPEAMHYSHWRGDRETLKHDQQLVCLNSLYKLRGQMAYDEVWLDEPRVCINALTCVATANGHLADNYDYLRALIARAKLTIFADADLEVDGAVPTLVQSISGLEPHEIEVHRYLQFRFSRNFECTANAEKWEKELDAALESGQSVAIPCRTKKQANILFQKYHALYRTKIYTGETHKDVVDNDMRDINAALDRTQLIIFTSKIAVGVDITVPVDRVFVHAQYGAGPCARLMLQLCGRLRNLANERIPILVTEKMMIAESKCAQTFDNALRQLERRSSRVKKMVETNMVRWLPCFDAEGFPRFSPDHFTQLVAYDIAEMRRTFLVEFERQAIAQGGTISFDESNGLFSDEYVDARTTVETNKAAEKAAALENVAARGAQAILNDAAKPGWPANQREKIEADFAFTARRWEPELRGTDLEKADAKWPQLVSLAQLSRDDDELQMLDLRTVMLPIADIHGSFVHAVHRSLKEAVNLLGFETVLDVNARIPRGEFLVHEKRLLELCEEAREQRRGRPCRSTDIVDILRAELKAVYGVKLVTEYKGTGKGKAAFLALKPDADLLRLAATCRRFAS